jgi:MFS family permease
VYFGSFIGYLTLSSISDNYGRKTSLVLSMAIAAFGSIIVSSSINIIMLSIGLIFCGIGINPSIGTIYLIFS